MNTFDTILNRYIGPKTLVFDTYTGPIITKFYSATSLRQQGVSNFVKIGQAIHYGETIIYVLYSRDVDIVQHLCWLSEAQKSCAYHQFILILVPDNADNIIEDIDTNHIYVDFWNPFPINISPNIWTFQQHKPTINSLQTIINNFGYPREIRAKTNPIVKNWCLHLKELYIQEGKVDNGYTLIILDRNIVLLPLIIQDLIYNTMLVDYCGLKFNTAKIDNITYKLEDNIFTTCGFTPYHQCIDNISTKTRTLQRSQPELTAVKIDSLSDVIKQTDIYLKDKTAVELHLKLAERYISKVEYIHKIVELQYAIVELEDVKEEIQCIIADKYPSFMVCIVVILYNIYIRHDDEIMTAVEETYGNHVKLTIERLVKQIGVDQQHITKIIPYVMATFYGESYLHKICCWAVQQLIEKRNVINLLPTKSYAIKMIPDPPPEEKTIWTQALEWFQGPVNSAAKYVIYIMGSCTFAEIGELHKLYPQTDIICDRIVTVKEYVEDRFSAVFG